MPHWPATALWTVLLAILLHSASVYGSWMHLRESFSWEKLHVLFNSQRYLSKSHRCCFCGSANASGTRSKYFCILPHRHGWRFTVEALSVPMKVCTISRGMLWSLAISLAISLQQTWPKGCIFISPDKCQDSPVYIDQHIGEIQQCFSPLYKAHLRVIKQTNICIYKYM